MKASPIVGVFIAFWMSSAIETGLWDVSGDALDTADWARSNLIVAAVFTSCMPMVFSGNVGGFCVAIGAFACGGAAIALSKHPLAYSFFHMCLGVFALAIVYV